MSQLVLADEIFAKESVLKIDTEAIAHNFNIIRQKHRENDYCRH